MKPGRIFDSMGTAEAVVVALDRPLTDPAIGRLGYAQGAHVVDNCWYALGGIHGSGASIEWLHDLLGREIPLASLIAEAARVPPGSHGACFLPHLRMGNAPHPDGKSRGALIGLTTDCDRPAIVRAVFEGLAFGAQASLEPLLAFAGIHHAQEVICIGGGSRNELLLRIKAAVANASMIALNLDEATALGAAILAGIGAGVYRGPDEAVAMLRTEPRTIEPDAGDVPHYAACYRDVYLPLYDALRPLHHRIHAWSTSSTVAQAGDPAD
jgi:xylulokinase